MTSTAFFEFPRVWIFFTGARTEGSFTAKGMTTLAFLSMRQSEASREILHFKHEYIILFVAGSKIYDREIIRVEKMNKID